MDRGLLLNQEMVKAALDGTKIMTRRPCKESFVYSLTDDRTHGILTDVNVNSRKGSYGKADIEGDSGISELGLHGWIGWTNILSDEIQRLWEKGIRGLVSVKRAQNKKGIPVGFALPQKQKSNEIDSSSCLYGVSWNARESVLAGETFGWQPKQQQARKLTMGYAVGELAGQESSRPRHRRGKAPDGKANEQGVLSFEVGNQNWTVQSATGSKGLGHVSGWNIAYSQLQAGMKLYVRETFWQYGRYVFTGKKTATGKPEVKFEPIRFTQQSEGLSFDVHTKPENRYEIGWHKRPSIFMPKWAARIWFEIVGVRVEKLQSISDKDCIAEGLSPNQNCDSDNFTDFLNLWYGIYGNEPENPWLWVYDLKRIEL